VSSATASSSLNAPVISTRTVQTVLLVRDSQTWCWAARGRQRQTVQGGVPVLSEHPPYGGLFGRTSRQNSETEFFLFLTPRIIRTDADADAITRPLEQRSGAGRR
jgi:general secretion pathway protein D